MKVKLVELVNSVDVLRELAGQKLPAKVAYTLHKNIQSVQNELDAYDKARINLVKKFGTPKEDSPEYEFTDEKKKEFFKELDDLLGMEVNLNARKIQLLEEMNLSANDTALVLWLLEEPKEE